jgi:hypothetical protein
MPLACSRWRGSITSGDYDKAVAVAVHRRGRGVSPARFIPKPSGRHAICYQQDRYQPYITQVLCKSFPYIELQRRNSRGARKGGNCVQSDTIPPGGRRRIWHGACSDRRKVCAINTAHFLQARKCGAVAICGVETTARCGADAMWRRRHRGVASVPRRNARVLRWRYVSVWTLRRTTVLRQRHIGRTTVLRRRHIRSSTDVSVWTLRSSTVWRGRNRGVASAQHEKTAWGENGTPLTRFFGGSRL